MKKNILVALSFLLFVGAFIKVYAVPAPVDYVSPLCSSSPIDCGIAQPPNPNQSGVQPTQPASSGGSTPSDGCAGAAMITGQCTLPPEDNDVESAFPGSDPNCDPNQPPYSCTQYCEAGGGSGQVNDCCCVHNFMQGGVTTCLPGACAEPNLATPTPVNLCGNAACDNGETCATCPGDCGACGGGGIINDPGVTGLTCNAQCSGSNECASGYCYGGFCRNSGCLDDTRCECNGASCNASCSLDAECAAAKDGCTSCVGGVCQPDEYPDLFAEAVGIDGGEGGNGQDREVILKVGQVALLSSLVQNINRGPALPSTGRFCLDSMECLTNNRGTIAEVPLPAMGVMQGFGGNDSTWWFEATHNWVVDTTVGQHFIWFCADVYNTSGEPSSLKLNNCGSKSFRVESDELACGSVCTQNADCEGAKDGCVACVAGANGVKTCQEPPACNSACSLDADCAGARDGCVACVGGTCQEPPACNVACSRDADCAGARDGCTACVEGANGVKTCQEPPSCNSSCTLDADCAGAKDGCVACVAGANGVKTCQEPPSCNSACSLDADCAGAKDGCVACVEGANGVKTCQEPPSCNSSCSLDADCAGARDGCVACIGGTCQEPPSCNSACSLDADCAGARDGCVACIGGTCQEPPSCNSSCTLDADCAGAKDGCTACVDGTCRQPPACNVACSKDSECAGARDGCTSCIGGTCSDFSQNMCKCDGIEMAQIASGQEFEVTNFEKVEGQDIRKARVKDMTFYMTKDGAIISKSNPIGAVVESSSDSKVRYKSTWKVQAPSNPDPNAEYRIFAQVTCEKKSAFSYTPQTRSVMGETTKQPSFLQRIVNFFASLFGARPTTTTQQTTAVPSGTQTTPRPLQIGTFSPANILEKSCRFVRFKF